MKKLGFLFVLCMSVFSAKAQTFDWSSDMPADPFLSSGQVKSIMYQGKLYHFSDSIGNYIRVTMYNPEVGNWRRIMTENTYISGFDRIEGQVINDKAYFVTGGSGGMYVHMFDFNTNTIVGYNSILATGGLQTNWDFKIVPGLNVPLVMYMEGSTANICMFNAGSNTWNTPFTLPAAFNSDFQIYFSSTQVYYAISGGGLNTLRVAPISDPLLVAPYNSTGGNDSYLRNELGNFFTSGKFFLVGNGQSAPKVYMQNYANQTTYEKIISGTSDIQLNTVSDLALDFNIDTNNFAIAQNASHAFVISNFNPAGSGTAWNTYVFSKDWNTGIWDTLGIQVPPTAGLNNQLMISLDQNGQHVAINYQNDGYYYYNVSNTKPEINLPSIIPTTGTCANQQNLLYHALEFYDDNKDGPLRMFFMSDANGVVSGLSAELIYFDNTVSPAVTKYAIYGHVGAAGNTNIELIVTDGYSNTSITLPSVAVGTTIAPNVIFSSNPLNLCKNENLINLANYVNYYDHGTFTINGNPITGTMIDGTLLSQTFTSGPIAFRDEIGGCIVTASASVTFPALPSATVVSTPSACGSATGTATVTFTAGSSPNYSLEWSTGETTTTISNLVPGPYYYSATDDYNCHFTGVTSVGATGVSITPAITNVSCHGLNDGAITINIVNPNAYQFLWSNGYGTQTISNLAAGNYSVNVWDNNGCQVSASYTITQPDAMIVNLVGTSPSCGNADGSVTSSVIASGTPVLEWIGTGQTSPTLINAGQGLYTLKVTDGNNCVKEFPFQLNDAGSVDINTTVFNTACNQNNGGISVNLNPGLSGAATSWSWSNGTTTQSNFNLAEGSYTITVANGPASQPCYASKTVFVGTKAPLSQPICLVTVDTMTTTNLIVWEKTELSGIDHYKIYRESDLAGNYQLIDTVHADNLSYFNDVVASPMDRSWRYKLSAVNACGAESPVSAEHKTLHLNTILNTGNGSFDVLWDDYAGSGNVDGYVVWRKTDQVDWLAVSPSIPLGTSAYNDTPPAGSTGVDYYIEMLLNSPCTAEKAQDFNTTRSNRERGQFAAGQGVEGASSNSIDENYLEEIRLYPNPTQGEVIFVQPGKEKITFRVTSLSGQEILKETSSDSKFEIQLHEFQSGIYLVEISAAGSKIVKRISKY